MFRGNLLQYGKAKYSNIVIDDIYSSNFLTWAAICPEAHSQFPKSIQELLEKMSSQKGITLLTPSSSCFFLMRAAQPLKIFPGNMQKIMMQKAAKTFRWINHIVQVGAAFSKLHEVFNVSLSHLIAFESLANSLGIYKDQTFLSTHTKPILIWMNLR